MSEEREIRWFCFLCLEDQASNIWDHYDKVTGQSVCLPCKTKGGIDFNATRSDTIRDIDGNKLSAGASTNETGMHKPESLPDFDK